MKLQLKQGGFTLAELLVVVSIIMVLVTSMFFGISMASQRSKHQRVRDDITKINELVALAQLNSGKILEDISGYRFPEGECWNKGLLHNLPKTDPCWDQYFESIRLLNEAAGGDYLEPPIDPWGGPYMFEPNEGQGLPNGSCCNGLPAGTCPSSTKCYADTVQSAGPDNIIEPGNTDDTDNIWTWVEPGSCSPPVYCWQDQDNNWEWD